MKKLLYLSAACMMAATSCKKSDPLQPVSSSNQPSAQTAALAPRYYPIVTSVTQGYNHFTGNMDLAITFNFDMIYMLQTTGDAYYCLIDASNTITSAWAGPFTTTHNPANNTFVVHNNFAYMTGQRIAVMISDYGPYPASGTVTSDVYSHIGFGTIQ